MHLSFKTLNSLLIFKLRVTVVTLKRILGGRFPAFLLCVFLTALGRWCTLNRCSWNFLLQKFLSTPGTSSERRRAWFLLHPNIGHGGLLHGVQEEGEGAQVDGDVEVLALGGQMPAKVLALEDQARVFMAH